MTRDKGLPELVSAFQCLRDSYPELRLLLLGEFEEGDPVPAWVAEAIRRDTRIVAPGFVLQTAVYYLMMDVLALPSRSKGFPTVALEAGAAGKPVVGTRATGIIDAVIDKQTGLLTRIGDVPALTQALARLLDDPELARCLGQAGRERACCHFQAGRVWQAIERLYHDLLPTSAVTTKARTHVRPTEPTWLSKAETH